MSYIQSVMSAWEGDRGRQYLRLNVIALAVLVFVLNRFSVFVQGVESRPGVVLNDPLLNALPVFDLSWPTFLLIYGTLIIGTSQLLKYPRELFIAINNYSIMVLFRIVAMSLTPLDPPVGMIILEDPIVQLLGTPDQITLTRDLFFSGHTATAFLMLLNAHTRGLKIAFAISTFAIASMVLLQRVHYSIDVLVAPFVTYAAYRLSLRLSTRFWS